MILSELQTSVRSSILDNNRLDMIHRQWDILKYLDVEPNYTTIENIQNEIKEKGYVYSEKTIIRDLQVLKKYFGIAHKNKGVAYKKDGIKPFITSDYSFLLQQIEDTLSNLLPESAILVICAYFNSVKNITRNSENINHIKNKIEVLYNSSLIPPKVPKDIIDNIYHAVLNENKVEIKYFKYGWKKPKKYILNSIGIVIKDQNIYFVCKDDDKDYFMHLPAQRIEYIKILNEKSIIPENFNLKEYARDNVQKWDIEEDSELIDFKAEFDNGIAFMIKESPISKNQIITEKEDGSIIVEAKIPDSVQLRGFLLSLGDQVKVTKPKVLRDFFKDTIMNLASMYRL